MCPAPHGLYHMTNTIYNPNPNAPGRVFPSALRTAVALSVLTGYSLPLSFSFTLDMSMVQNSVSAKVEGVVFDVERVRILLGWLMGGVCVASAYDALALGWDEVVNTGWRIRMLIRYRACLNSSDRADVRKAIEVEIRTRENMGDWRYAAVVKEARNPDRVKVICRDESEIKIVKDAA